MELSHSTNRSGGTIGPLLATGENLSHLVHWVMISQNASGVVRIAEVVVYCFSDEASCGGPAQRANMA